MALSYCPLQKQSMYDRAGCWATAQPPMHACLGKCTRDHVMAKFIQQISKCEIQLGHIHWLQMDHKLNCKTIKILGKNMEDLQDQGLGREFLDLTPKAQFIRRKKNSINWISSKFKMFALWKTLIRGWKAKPWMGRKYLQITCPTKD